MMDSTKHDLSYDEVKLDYDALVKTAGTAYGLSLSKVESIIGELHQIEFDWLTGKNKNDYDKTHSANTHRHCAAYRLKKATENLSVAAETYSALLDGEVRNTKELINFPETDKDR